MRESNGVDNKNSLRDVCMKRIAAVYDVYKIALKDNLDMDMTLFGVFIDAHFPLLDAIKCSNTVNSIYDVYTSKLSPEQCIGCAVYHDYIRDIPDLEDLIRSAWFGSQREMSQEGRLLRKVGPDVTNTRNISKRMLPKCGTAPVMSRRWQVVRYMLMLHVLCAHHGSRVLAPIDVRIKMYKMTLPELVSMCCAKYSMRQLYYIIGHFLVKATYKCGSLKQYIMTVPMYREHIEFILSQTRPYEEMGVMPLDSALQNPDKRTCVRKLAAMTAFLNVIDLGVKIMRRDGQIYADGVQYMCEKIYIMSGVTRIPLDVVVRMGMSQWSICRIRAHIKDGITFKEAKSLYESLPPTDASILRLCLRRLSNSWDITEVVLPNEMRDAQLRIVRTKYGMDRYDILFCRVCGTWKCEVDGYCKDGGKTKCGSNTDLATNVSMCTMCEQDALFVKDLIGVYFHSKSGIGHPKRKAHFAILCCMCAKVVSNVHSVGVYLVCNRCYVGVKETYSISTVCYMGCYIEKDGLVFNAYDNGVRTGVLNQYAACGVHRKCVPKDIWVDIRVIRKRAKLLKAAKSGVGTRFGASRKKFYKAPK